MSPAPARRSGTCPASAPHRCSAPLARTMTARVAGSTRESTLTTRAGELATRIGVGARLHRLARRAARPHRDSGTAKSTLMVLMSSSVVMTVPGLISAPRLTRRRPTRPRERRADVGIGKARLCGRDPRLVGLHRGLELLVLRLATPPAWPAGRGCDCTGCGSRSKSAVCRGEIGARLRTVELHQYLAGLAPPVRR